SGEGLHAETEAVSQGEDGAEVPVLRAVRPGLSARRARGGLGSGGRQRRRTWSGWRERRRRARPARRRRGVPRPNRGGAQRQDAPTAGGAPADGRKTARR